MQEYNKKAKKKKKTKKNKTTTKQSRKDDEKLSLAFQRFQGYLGKSLGKIDFYITYIISPVERENSSRSTQIFTINLKPNITV